MQLRRVVTTAPRFWAAPASVFMAVTTAQFTITEGAVVAPLPHQERIQNVGPRPFSALSATILSYTGAETSWLSATVQTIGGMPHLVLLATRTNLAPGSYSALVEVSGGPGTAPQVFTIGYVVHPAAVPIIAFVRTATDYTTTVGGANPPSDFIALYNAGPGSWSGAYFESTPTYSGPHSGWASWTLTDAGLSLNYNVGAITTDGMTTLTFRVTAPGTNNVAQTQIYLRMGAGATAPIIGVSPGTINFTLMEGEEQGPITLNITNLGGGSLGTLGMSILGTPPAWASLSYTAGAASGTFDPSTASLPIGQYTCTIRCTASAANNGFVDVPVFITVQPQVLVPLLRYPLPGGLTQDPVTGYVQGVPTGIDWNRPVNWNDATPDFVCTTTAQLQSALAAQASMDWPVIEIPAGVQLTGGKHTWMLPPRTGAGYCVIRTGNYALMPPMGTRVDPSIDGPNLAWIRSSSNEECLATLNGANHYYFHGIGFRDTGAAARGGNGTTDQVGIVRFVPQNSTTNHSTTPHHIVVDQCIGEGHPLGYSDRWMVTEAHQFLMRDSYAYDFFSVNKECQAVLIPDTMQFGMFDNCYFHAAGENVMIGGSELKFNNLAMMPTDIYFRRCRFEGQFSWFSWHPSYAGINVIFKNLWEIKRGERVLLDGCVLNEGGRDAQQGLMLVIKSEDNYYYDPSVVPPMPLPSTKVSITKDVQVIDCWLYDIRRAFALLGNSSPNLGGRPTENVHVLNCLVTRINIPPNDGHVLNEILFRIVAPVIEHVTIWKDTNHTAQGLLSTEAGIVNARVTDNIFPKCNYGVTVSGLSPGTPSLSTWVNGTFTRNVLYAGGTHSSYPPGNFLPATIAAVGFVNGGGPTPLDYALGPTSPYLTASATGGPLGANMQRIYQRTLGV